MQEVDASACESDAAVAANGNGHRGGGETASSPRGTTSQEADVESPPSRKRSSVRGGCIASASATASPSLMQLFSAVPSEDTRLSQSSFSDKFPGAPSSATPTPAEPMRSVPGLFSTSSLVEALASMARLEPLQPARDVSSQVPTTAASSVGSGASACSGEGAENRSHAIFQAAPSAASELPAAMAAAGGYPASAAAGGGGGGATSSSGADAGEGVSTGQGQATSSTAPAPTPLDPNVAAATAAALAAASAAGQGADTEAPQEWMEHVHEIHEYQALSIGPFMEDFEMEILHAWYGHPTLEERRVDVTETLRNLVNVSECKLQMSSSDYYQFGDPAPLVLKRLVVRYRVRAKRPWHLSKGHYTEGIWKPFMAVPITTKLLTNIIGASFATIGYTYGKVETVGKHLVGSILGNSNLEEAEVCDTHAFRLGFQSWLWSNGIFPTVTYADLPEAKADKHDMRQTPLLVSNHICYLDGLILAAVFGAPRVLAMKGSLDVPLIGRFASEIGVIEVDREAADSRKATLKALEEHVNSWRVGARPMLVFPEGMCTNGEGLIEFKKGAFVTGAPVRPCVIAYTGNWDPATVSYKRTSHGEIEPTSDREWVEQFLGHFVHSLRIHVLPPYVPNAEEKADAALYARNVRQAMLEAHQHLRREIEGTMSWGALVRKPFDQMFEGTVEMGRMISSAASSI